jgi:hypothetical protein
LSKFDIKLVHIPEKKNIQVDSLLRRPDSCPQGTDNKDVMVLPEHLFVNLIDMELQQQQDILESFKHLMWLRNIIGGQGFESLSRTTSKDVEHVNNSKLTEIHQNQRLCL